MKAIVCLDAKNGIGKDGKLLISIPDDMKFFKETTKDSIVVMGRKTLFSFKNKAPLKNRLNVVFTSNVNLQNEYKEYDNIIFINNKKELDDIIDRNKEKQVFLIGGAKVYSELLEKCDEVYVTRLDKVYVADSFFPDLEKNKFIKIKESSEKEYNGIKYKFLVYKKV